MSRWVHLTIYNCNLLLLSRPRCLSQVSFLLFFFSLHQVTTSEEGIELNNSLIETSWAVCWRYLADWGFVNIYWSYLYYHHQHRHRHNRIYLCSVLPPAPAWILNPPPLHPGRTRCPAPPPVSPRREGSCGRGDGPGVSWSGWPRWMRFEPASWSRSRPVIVHTVSHRPLRFSHLVTGCRRQGLTDRWVYINDRWSESVVKA